MGKAANRKRERKQADKATTTQAISAPQNEGMDDMLIVMNLMTAIELNNLAGFQSAVNDLEASGSDLFHFEIKLIEDDGQGTDMSLLHYAIYMGAEDIIAWIIRCGVHADDEESISELQGMMQVLNFGGDDTHDLALYQRLILKFLRPDTIYQAMSMLEKANAGLKEPGISRPCLSLMEQAASEFLSSQWLQSHSFNSSGDNATTTS